MYQLKDDNSQIRKIFIESGANKSFPFLQKSNPSMSAVNKMLTMHSTVREAIWQHFQLPETCKLPQFDNELLYGAVSSIIHNPNYRNVIVSDKSVLDYANFFQNLADFYGRSLQTFNEELAAAYGADLNS